MSRFMALALCFVLPTAAHAASLKDFELWRKWPRKAA